MSSKKTAQRRIGLMAGSSLLAALLSAGAFSGAALTPTAVLAANECTPSDDPSLNGSAADSYECSAGTYASGITYSSDGDLTVTKTTTTTTTITANGVNLTGNGSDDVTWDSSLGTVSGGSSTNGPVIDVTSDTGDISITTASVSGTSAGVTHGVRATSTGGGDITISRTSGSSSITGTGSQAVIEAVTSGGDINMSLSGTTQGRLRGIVAQTSGSGDVTLNVAGDVKVNTGAGIVAIDTVAGTGSTEINIASGAIGQQSPGASVVIAIRSVSASTSASAVNVQNTGGSITNGVDFSGVAGGVVFNNAGATASTGRWLAVGDSSFGAGDNTLIMDGVGENSLADNGSITFGGGDDVFMVTDRASFSIGSTAITVGGSITNFINPGASIDFGAGDDLFSLEGSGVHFFQENTFIDFGAGDDTLNLASNVTIGGYTTQLGAEIDFGTGADTLNNSGLFSADGPIVLSNLEAFNNSGTIYLGLNSSNNLSRPVFDGTDRRTNDILTVAGATFTGSGASRLAVDVLLDTNTQGGCDAPTGAADCLYLPGGATAGVTGVVIYNASDVGIIGGYNPTGVTVVDVAGGTSAAGHFVVDPSSPTYIDDPTYGGSVSTTGLFVYTLRYDAANQRHVVIGLPRSEAVEYAMLSSAAQSIWHMTADTVTDRQTDLRNAPETGSLWMRTTGEYSKRDVGNSISTIQGDSYSFDESYKLYAGTIMGGMDLIQGRSGDYDYVLGAQIGYVGSSFELNASPSSGHFSGATGGIYGSVWTPNTFLDATFNLNGLTLDYDAPGLGSKTNTYTTAFGARLEGGMRYPLSDVFIAEPLLTLAFVRTGFEEISLTGGEIRPADSQSRRAALGLRVGGDIDGQMINWSYFALGRAWYEFDGESEGVVSNPGADLAFMDEFDGGFGEVEAGLTLYNDANTLSGFAATGVKWQDGYSAIDLSLGLRMNW